MSEFLAGSTALFAPSDVLPETLASPIEMPGILRRVGQFVLRQTVGSLVGADIDYTRRIWPLSETGIHPLQRQVDTETYPESWVVFPGFGSTDGKSKAHLLSQYLPANQPVAYFDISNQGTNSRELGEQLNHHITKNGVERISCLGHSMGLLRFLGALEYVDTPVERILADGSPSGLETVKFKDVIERLSQR